jgi:hypothetical protein
MHAYIQECIPSILYSGNYFCKNGFPESTSFEIKCGLAIENLFSVGYDGTNIVWIELFNTIINGTRYREKYILYYRIN